MCILALISIFTTIVTVFGKSVADCSVGSATVFAQIVLLQVFAKLFVFLPMTSAWMMICYNQMGILAKNSIFTMVSILEVSANLLVALCMTCVWMMVH